MMPSQQKSGCRRKHELSSSSAGSRNSLSPIPHLTFRLTCMVLTGQIHVHFGGSSARDHPPTHTRTKLPTRVHVDRTCIPPTTFFETVPFSHSNAHGCGFRLAVTWNLSPSSLIRQTGWVCEISYELPGSATLQTSPMIGSPHTRQKMEPRTRIRPSRTSASSSRKNDLMMDRRLGG